LPSIRQKQAAAALDGGLISSDGGVLLLAGAEKRLDLINVLVGAGSARLAYHFAKHLKAVRWRTPFQAICDAYKADPGPFKINPHHLIPGPYT
jgi:hypothetical protein